MRSFIFYAMVVLMVLWTIVFMIELTYVYYASAAFETFKASEYTVTDFFVFYEALRLEIWNATAAARLAVWALPMIVFAIVSAVTQPSPR
jgi:hypothetical protein